ncbi:hypothetical protein GE061_015247 [Apolygus lucorum]|uniref:Uncharacterized protein n=1 Tax=Apolygus lucorum TaxID=248454 RepID=A0A8S9XKD8_APOLU|nr:hypothetical protein GE061_015247 [Apolygus lucorum]
MRSSIYSTAADKTCTCEIPRPQRSLSSTELETDSASTTTSGTFVDLQVGECFPDDDDSVDLTPSEESSAESAVFDPTKIKWISNASDPLSRQHHRRRTGRERDRQNCCPLGHSQYLRQVNTN